MPTPCTVTGSLQQLTSGAIVQGTVIFELTNVGTGNPIGVIGTSLFPALRFQVQTAPNGTFTTQLWGNDNINPANTLYNVSYRDALGNIVGPILYSITGTNVNLNSLAAATSILPPVMFSIPNSARFTASGTNLLSTDYLLTGWGAGATITAIHGSDMAHRFTITAGTAPSISPTIQLTFHDGAWAFSPVITAMITGGTGSVTDLSVASATTTYTLTYEGLPVATQTYIINVICIGVLN